MTGDVQSYNAIKEWGIELGGIVEGGRCKLKTGSKEASQRRKSSAAVNTRVTGGKKSVHPIFWQMLPLVLRAKTNV